MHGFLSSWLSAYKRCSLQKDWSTAGHTASGNLRMSTSCLKGSSENASCLSSRDLKMSDLGEVAFGHSLSLAGQ